MKRYAYVILAATIAFTVGCGKGNFSERTQANKADAFTYPIVTNPTSLDPGVVQDGDTIDLLQQVYEGLVTWDENNAVVPALAEKWDISADGLVYTFTLKKGAKFHSGREVKAEDFKWTFERNTAPGFVTTTPATYLSDIVGLKDKIDGKATEISGIKVVDDYTLQITIDKPRPYFLGKLTYIVSSVLDKDKAPADEIKSADQMIGTGPFRVTKYVPDQTTVLEAFNDYHGGAPQIAKIERPVIKDAATRLSKYKAGEIDLVMLERQDVEGLQKDEKFKDHLQFFDRPSTWYIGLNQDVVKEFKDPRVRRAFAMAIDKEVIVNEYLGGVNKVANSVVPPGVAGHRANAKSIPFNPAEAKKLLAEAGYPGGKGFPQLEITFREQRPDLNIVALTAAQQLKENLGITVKTRTMEWRSYLEKHSANKMPFFHMRWAADYLDPENYLSLLLASYGAENHVGYRNPEYDKLCAAADVEMDNAKRMEMYAKAEDIMLQDAPFIPIYFQRDAELINPKVKGLRESLFGHLPHTTVRIEKAP